MADGVNVKMGVSGLNKFKQDIKQAQESVKTYDAELKLAEKQLQATGDREAYMQQKTKLLQQQIAAQNNVIKQCQQALTAMEKQGINPASQAYQQMQQRLLNAESALIDMRSSLDNVGDAANDTAQRTDRLADSLNSINKKVSFDAVINGIGKITDGMEAAAKKVSALARDVWDTMALAASWADNENTLAAMYGLDVETLQRMQGASRTIDTSVESIVKSRQKLKQNMASDSQEIADAFDKLGVSIGEVNGQTGIMGKLTEFAAMFTGRELTRTFRSWEDVFWDTGDALLKYGDEVERDVLAQRIFGRSWMELMPLFQAGREEYEKTLDAQSIVTQQNVGKLNALDDALQRLDQEYQTTKYTLLSELAPAFTTVGDTLTGLLGKFNEYLQTEEGQEKLEGLSQAVTELFSGLSDADFGAAIDTASGILTTIRDTLGWIADNKEGVVTAITAIGGAFLGLQAAQVVGTLVQSASALKNLIGSGAAGAAGAGAAGAGAAGAAGGWLSTALKSAGSFMVGKALPVGLGAYLGFTAGGIDAASDDLDSLYDKNGKVTKAGRELGLPATKKEYDEWTAEQYLEWAKTGTSAKPSDNEGVLDVVKEAHREAEAKANAMRRAHPVQEHTQLTVSDLVAMGIIETPEELTDEQKHAAQVLWDNLRANEFQDPGGRLMGAMQYYFPGDMGDRLISMLGETMLQLINSSAASGVDLPEDLPDGWWLGQDGLKVDTQPVLQEDAAEQLQKQLSGVELQAEVAPEPTAEQKHAAQVYWDEMRARDFQDPEGRLTAAMQYWYPGDEGAQLLDVLGKSMLQMLIDSADNGWVVPEDLPEGWWLGPDGMEVNTDPVLSDDAAEQLQEQLSGVTLQVDVAPKAAGDLAQHANGLPFVPFDGYIAALHKGERIVPANQNKSYSANSNLYVEKMYMNNGQDAQGLAAAMAAENMRIRAGFGS